MSLRMIDFRCKACGNEFELMIETEKQSSSFAQCGCGGDAVRIIKKAPGIHGEENFDAHWMRAARLGVTHGTGNQYIPPFRGNTRSELKAWMRQHGLVGVPTSEINSRGVVINSKTDFMETAHFQRKFDASMREALAVAKAGEAAVKQRVAQIERTNDFDANAFAAQQSAGAAVIVGDDKAKYAAENTIADDVREVTPLIAEELAS